MNVLYDFVRDHFFFYILFLFESNFSYFILIQQFLFNFLFKYNLYGKAFMGVTIIFPNISTIFTFIFKIFLFGRHDIINSMESYIIKLSEKCRIIDSVYKKVPLHILMVIIETLCNRTILSQSEHCRYREDLKYCFIHGL